MKRIGIWFLLLLVWMGGCAKTDGRDGIEEEQRLIMYTSHAEEVYGPLVREFEERSGIWVEVKEAGALYLLEQIKEGNSGCDLFLGGSVELMESYGELFEVYAPVSYTYLVLLYNPKLVKNNPPEGWSDLLDPVWKGEIAFADPEKSGSACMALRALKKTSPEEMTEERLMENLDGNLLFYSRDVVSEVANGNYYIGVTMEEAAIRGMEAGYDIFMVYPEEGENLLTDVAAVCADSAHRENAKEFLEFLRSEDAQLFIETYLNRYGAVDSGEVAE